MLAVDDAMVLMSTVIMLEDLGCHVVEATGGAQALVQLGERRVDLLITDQAMPNMSGTELAQTARRLRPDLLVVLATGSLDPSRADAPIDIIMLLKPGYRLSCDDTTSQHAT